MKHWKLLGAALLLLLPIFAWVGIAGAQSFKSGTDVTVSQDQTVDSMLFTSGRNVDIAGTVNGDIFCASGNVTISGKVNGDVLCAAQTIRISGTVNGSVRLAAQTVNVSSSIAGDASIAAQNITVEQTGVIGRDASLAASDIILNGSIGRDAALTGKSIIVTSSVARNVKANVENLTLESKAKIGGDVSYTSKNDASIQKGATVAGVTHRYTPKAHEKKGVWAHLGILLSLYMLVASLVIALAAVLLLPRQFQQITDVAVRRPGFTLLVGLVAALLFPALFIVLLFTVVGIPLAFFLLLIWLLLLAFGCLSFYYYVGRMVLRNGRNAVVIMLVGALIVLVASLIPFLGVLVDLMTALMGIGMVLLNLRSHYRRPTYDVSL